jgi:hypothetical protein
MNRYVVLCDCDGNRNRRTIAWIDDERPHGSVRIESHTSFTAIVRVPNQRGGRINYRIRCKACGKEVFLSETTAGDIIDRLAPIRDTLEVASIPALDQLLVPLGKQAPADVVHKSRCVIPFLTLCNIVRKLGEAE